MGESSFLDRLTALSIVVCVIAVPAWVTFSFSSSKPEQPEDQYEQYLEGTGAWAESTLESLTLEEKVSQLFFHSAYGVYSSADDPSYKQLVDMVERFKAGGVVFFQGDPFSQALLANDLQSRAEIPLIAAQDMEHGAGMRITRTTKFPSAMAMGATRNKDLVYAAGLATAREARALGIYQVYAPVADINNNARNPVINVRSFGERPRLVANMVSAFTYGLQDGNVLATAKHFPGHGDTATDSHSELPVLPFSRARLDSVELVPFRAARDAGILSMMLGHLALPQLESDPNVPATLTPAVVNNLLRQDMGFKGLIVTDAMRMHGITKYFGVGESAVRAIEAGVDVLVLSNDEYAARAAILRAIESGRLTEERIDESVLRLLKAKEWLRLNEHRIISTNDTRRIVANTEHTVLSQSIARESVTLVKNSGNIVPLIPAPKRIMTITLSDTDDPTRGSYFNTQMRSYSPSTYYENRLLDVRSTQDDFTEALYEANYADLIVVPTYLPVRSGTNRLALPASLQRFLNSLLLKNKPIILISFGSPYIVQALSNQPNVYIAAYGDSEASQKAVAQALFGFSTISGKLPITIPGYYDFGSGIEIPQRFIRRGYPEEVGLSSDVLTRADSLIHASIADRAFPGAAVAVGRGDVLVKLDSYGYFTYQSERQVAINTKFDLASLTKVVATTTAAMQLYEQGKLSLDDKVAKFLPQFAQNGKENITIHNLLTHTSGLKPFRPFHQEGITTRRGVINEIYAEPLVYATGSESRYSDFNMIMLALVIEQITGQRFSDYSKANIFNPLGMRNTEFRVAGRGTNRSIVPTEVDNDFRKRLVQGEVHDETAYILGGTAGHAGLFSTAEDLAKFAFMMANEGMHNGRQFLKPETIKLFTTPHNPGSHTRALGWDTKSPEGYSSAGQYFSANSYGHTGFTGTSMWIDPESKLFLILLTNRVYPTRDNKKLTPVRSDLADIVHSAIKGPIEVLLPTIPN